MTAPQNEYSFVMPDVEEMVVENDAQSSDYMDTEDAASVDARHEKMAQDREAELMLKRSQTVQRELPRPLVSLSC